MSQLKYSELWDKLEIHALKRINEMTGGSKTNKGALNPYAVTLYKATEQVIKTYAPVYAGLVSALSAASSGDLVWDPAGTITGDISIPAGVTLIGAGIESSIIAGKVTLGDGSSFIGIFADNTGTTGNCYAVVGPSEAGQTAIVYNARGRATVTDGVAVGLALGDGTVNGYHSQFEGVATGSGSGYGVAMGEAVSSGTFNSWELPTEASASASGASYSNIDLPLNQEGDESNWAVVLDTGHITYNFGAVYNLTNITFYGAGDGNTYVEASEDGITWDVIEVKGVAGGENNFYTGNHTFTATNYRYLRFRDEAIVMVGGSWQVCWFKLTGSVMGVGSGTANLYWCKLSGTTDDIKSTGGTVNVYACQYDLANTTGTIVSVAGDRAAYDALNNQSLHANDIDEATGIHWTKGELGATYAPYVLNKLDATAAPTANDDSGDGYAINSVWVDVTNDNVYLCVDATATAAVWVEIGGVSVGIDALSELTDVALSSLADGDVLVYRVANDSSAWITTEDKAEITATASHGSASLTYALDGTVDNSQFNTGAEQALGMYVQFDFGAGGIKLSSIKQTCTQGSFYDTDYPRAWNILGSDMGAFSGEQTTVASDTASAAGTIETSFDPATFRYWRISLTGSAGNYWRVNEFDFYRSDINPEWVNEEPTGGSGDVATDTIWDAKGDLAVGSGANTADNLTVGTDGQVLTADAASTLGVKWAAVPALANHDHSGDAGDGGTFDAANLTSGAATDGQVLTADGSGGAAWETASGGAALTVEESDGTPTVANVTKIKVTNGTLTDNTGGTVTLDFGSAATDGAAIHDNTASEIHAITEKTTLADNDEFIIEDSADNYNKKRVKKSNLGAGSVTPLYSIWDPMAPPATPSAYDDEFDDDSFDTTLWTEFDPNSVQTVTEGDEGLVITKNHEATGSYTGIYQALPSGDFTIVTRVSLRAYLKSFTAFGLGLFEDATNSTKGIINFTFEYANDQQYFEGQRWTNYQSHNSSVFAWGDVGFLTGVFLRIRRNGTNLYFEYSTDGRGWAGYMNAYSQPFTPGHMGLIIYNTTGATIKGLANFFRYKNSDVGLTGSIEGQVVGVGSA